MAHHALSHPRAGLAQRFMRIGELARRAGLTADAVRYYERLGLLEPPARTRGNYRLYDAAALDRVAFIRKAQTLGLSLEQVGEALRIASAGTPPCTHVRALLERRLEEIAARIRALKSLESTLRKALTRSRSLPVTSSCVCKIIESAQLPRG